MKPTRNQLAFHKLLVNSINKLAKQYEINNIWDNRLYRLQIFYIKTNISFILVCFFFQIFSIFYYKIFARKNFQQKKFDDP